MLQALASVKGVTASDYVRLFIRERYAREFASKKN